MDTNFNTILVLALYIDDGKLGRGDSIVKFLEEKIRDVF